MLWKNSSTLEKGVFPTSSGRSKLTKYRLIREKRGKGKGKVRLGRESESKYLSFFLSFFFLKKKSKEPHYRCEELNQMSPNQSPCKGSVRWGISLGNWPWIEPHLGRETSC